MFAFRNYNVFSGTAVAVFLFITIGVANAQSEPEFARNLSNTKQVYPGETVKLGPVELSDPQGTVSYQWYAGGEPIEGATDKELEIPTMTREYSGRGMRYWVRVDDSRKETPVESNRVKLNGPHPETKEEIQAYKEALFQSQMTAYNYPEKRVKITSLAELAEYSKKSNVHVKMKPGTYDVTLDNYKDVVGKHTGRPYIFHFSGKNSLFDLRGVRIRFDSRLLHERITDHTVWGGIDVIRVSGKRLFIVGLNIQGVHEIHPDEVQVERADSSVMHMVFHLNKPMDISSLEIDSEAGGYPFAIQTSLAGDDWQKKYKGEMKPRLGTYDGGEDWKTVYKGEMKHRLGTYEFPSVKADRVRILGQHLDVNIDKVRINHVKWPPSLYGEDARDHANREGCYTLHVTGKANLFRDMSITSMGSFAYGYGRIIGKGSPSAANMKHAPINENGRDNVFMDCEIYPRTYAHVTPYNTNPVYINCDLSGILRSTNAMMRDDWDNWAYKEYNWTPDYVRSLHEDAWRTYQDRVHEGPMVLGSTVRTIDTGRIGGAKWTSDSYAAHHTVIGATGHGFAPGDGNSFPNSKVDFRYAKGAAIWKDGDEGGEKTEITLLPSPVPEWINIKRTFWGDPTAAKVKAHNGGHIVLKSGGDLKLNENDPRYIRVNGLKGSTFRNETELPIRIDADSKNSTIHTKGEVIQNKGQGMTIHKIGDEKQDPPYTATVVTWPYAGGHVVREPDQQEFDEGEEVTFKAVPADGYVFSHWSGDSTSRNRIIKGKMTKDLQLTANFIPAALSSE